MTAIRVPRLRSEEDWNSPSVDTWKEAVRENIEDRRLPIYAAASDVPSQPRQGDHALVTYGPASGNGYYIYDGAAWLKVTTSAGSLP